MVRQFELHTTKGLLVDLKCTLDICTEWWLFKQSLRHKTRIKWCINSEWAKSGIKTKWNISTSMCIHDFKPMC